MAINTGEDRWVLVNASPDFPAQVEGLPSGGALAGRRSPIDRVFLTNADLDHVLGLIAMRSEPVLRVHATAAVRRTLTEDISWDGLLRSFCRLEWEEVTESPAPLPSLSGVASTVDFRAIFLSGDPPPFARGTPGSAGQSVAYEFRDGQTGKRLVVAPDVAVVSSELLSALRRADAVLFDGTFWSDDELQRVKPGARTSREMGHLPIRDGSLELLQSLKATHKSYIHINNTNPILDPDSPERAAVTAAGIQVEEDGAEWTL